jgi:hypothetical protein
MFLEKAVDLADRLLQAFKPSAGLPHAMVNLKTYVFYNSHCVIAFSIHIKRINMQFSVFVADSPT